VIITVFDVARALSFNVNADPHFIFVGGGHTANW